MDIHPGRWLTVFVVVFVIGFVLYLGSDRSEPEFLLLTPLMVATGVEIFLSLL